MKMTDKQYKYLQDLIKNFDFENYRRMELIDEFTARKIVERCQKEAENRETSKKRASEFAGLTIINKKEVKKNMNNTRKITRTFRIPADLVERFDRAAELAGVNKTDVIVKAIEDFVLKTEREKVMNKMNQYYAYVKFGNELRNKLGNQAGVYAIQLSDALNISNNTDDFLQKLIKLCINYGLQIPIMPNEDEFTEKAQAVLLGLAGMPAETTE